MSRTLQWNDDYCPKGHKWIFCPATILYPDFYYCEEDDEFYEPTVKKLDVRDIAEQYNGDRPNQMVLYALSEQALREIRYKLNHSEIIALTKDTKSTKREPRTKLDQLSKDMDV
jgi:hypothetical protein